MTANGWCQEHQDKAKRPDQRSGAARERHKLYNSKLWTERLRPAQLLREPYCRECAKRGIRVRATDVDHIVPHEGDWERFTDPENLQSLCHSCHSAKTVAENQEKFRAGRP